MKRVLTLVLAVLLLVTSFAGCTSREVSETSQSSAVSGETSGTTAEENKEPITITWYWREGGDPEVTEDSYIAQKILQDLNIRYVHITPKGMDFTEKLQLLLAAQEVPDIIESYSDTTTNLKNYGVIIPLEKYFNEEHMGNFYKSVPNWEQAVEIVRGEDGHIWAVPAPNGTTISIVPYIRYDWLKNLGLEVPKTLDELKEVLVKFTKNDPDGNGKDDTYGMMIARSAMPFADYFAATPDRYFLDENGDVSLGMFLPRVKDWLKFAKSLIDEGAIEQDITNTDGNRVTNAIKAGKVGFGIGYYDATAVTWNDDIRKVQPEADWRPMPPVKGILDKGYLLESDVLRQQYVVSAKCKYPDEAIRLMNYMVEDNSTADNIDYNAPYWEVSYGKRGVNWDVTPDGKFDYLGNFFPQIAEQNKIDTWARGRARRFRTIADTVARNSALRDDQRAAWDEIMQYPRYSQIPKDNPLRMITYEGLEFPAEATRLIELYTSATWPEFAVKAFLDKVDIDKGWEEFVAQAEKDGWLDIKAQITEVFRKAGRIK